MARLESRPGWGINTLRQCYERGAPDEEQRIYPGDDGFAVSVCGGTWIEGIYQTFEEAVAAAEAAA